MLLINITQNLMHCYKDILKKYKPFVNKLCYNWLSSANWSRSHCGLSRWFVVEYRTRHQEVGLN